MADEYEDDMGGSAGEERGSAAQLEDADTLGAPTAATEEGFVPPDRPTVSEQDDMTARGMHEGESLDERLRREEPDAVPAGEGAGLGETEPPLVVADRAADAEVSRAREDEAARIDALRDAAGAAAPASGRADAGDVPGL